MASLTEYLQSVANNGGSISAGINADLDSERTQVCEEAIRRNLLRIHRDSWATGDYYELTSEGWRSIGMQPPSHLLPEPTFTDFMLAGLKVVSVVLLIALAAQFASWIFASATAG